MPESLKDEIWTKCDAFRCLSKTNRMIWFIEKQTVVSSAMWKTCFIFSHNSGNHLYFGIQEYSLLFLYQQEEPATKCNLFMWISHLISLPNGKLCDNSNVLFCCFCSESELSTSRLMVNSSEKVFRKNLPAYLQETREGWKVNATLVGLIRWVQSFWVLILRIIEVTILV